VVAAATAVDVAAPSPAPLPAARRAACCSCCGPSDDGDPAVEAALSALLSTPWHAQSADEVLQAVKSRAAGLSLEEVAASRARWGGNSATASKPPSVLRQIWGQLNNMLMYLLIGACIISGVFQDWPDFGLIIAVIILNVTIGVVQEGKAESAARALASLLSPRSMVVRGGQQVMVDTSDVVVGDILYVQAGDALGADVRWLSASSLRCLESALTGEAEPVDKDVAAAAAGAGLGDRRCCGFAGTTCVYGQGSGVVIGVGRATQIGAIRSLIEGATSSVTPLQAALEVFGRVIAVLTIIVAVVTLLIAYFARGYYLGAAFITAVAVAVAIIPEGLPSVVTVALALGVREMAAHNAIIRSLPAVETLGAVSVICSDKTGTLTQNKMTVENMWLSRNFVAACEK
jgi:magnesium-transporting ATPase (P-type)